jgi:sigma-B regulation protein RsbU (phosphoserine phosphatase)
MNVLRSRSLANARLTEPGEVLRALNQAFPMEEFGNKFFTMWYGVYDRQAATLSYAGAGHPPPLLLEGDSTQAIPLECDDPMIGAIAWDEYKTERRTVPPGSRLYLYSDGVHEIHKADGDEWAFDEFVQFMSQPAGAAVSLPAELLQHVRQLGGREALDDDFSMVEVRF